MHALVAHDFHVINLDARGHGDSDWSPTGDYRLEDLSADLMAIIEKLAGPPALVGASMGGATALHAIGNSVGKQIARAMILVDIVPRLESEGSRKIGNFMRANPDGFANLEEAADAVAAYNPNRPRPRDPTGLMKNLRRRDDGRLHWHWDPRLLQAPTKPEPPTFVDKLVAACPDIKVPSMLVRGLESDIVSDQGVADIRRLIPQIEVFDVEGAGHMVAGDKNDAFNEAVIDFLRRTSQ